VGDAGLLSERFFMYGEDMEWCWRIRKAGWKVGLCSKVEMNHAGGVSATRTWGKEEQQRRALRAHYDACMHMWGPVYARALLLVNIVSWATESYHPFRPREAKAVAREALRVHLDVFRED
jgi:GT2 family glycosyltransferase